MDREEPPSATLSATTAAFAVLLILAVGVSVFGGTLVPTLGISVVAAGLFLKPRAVGIVAAGAILLAAGLLFGLGLETPWYRLFNVVLASALGILVSFALDRRVRRIDGLRATEASIFSSVPDALAVLAADGTVLQSNAALAQLVPEAAVGQRLHPCLGHVLSNGTPCPGGCALDAPDTIEPSAARTPVEGESITRGKSRLAVEYTAGRVDGQRAIVSLRDVTALRAVDEDRRVLLEAAVRQGERETVLRALGAPMFTELADVRGLELDMWSEFSDTHEPTGGDVVDVLEMPDGRTLIMVVDATGEGVISVRDAWKVLYVSRAYIVSGTRLEEVLERTATTLAAESDPPNASVMIAVLDPRTGRLDLVGGGHPPALLIRENGASEWLESSVRGIGSSAGGPDIVITRQLLSGDSLILYTDGLVDGTGDVIQALSTLRSSAAALRRRPTPGWSQELAHAVQPAQKSGTATVLVVRLDSLSGGLQTSTTR